MHEHRLGHPREPARRRARRGSRATRAAGVGQWSWPWAQRWRLDACSVRKRGTFGYGAPAGTASPASPRAAGSRWARRFSRVWRMTFGAWRSGRRRGERRGLHLSGVHAERYATQRDLEALGHHRAAGGDPAAAAETLHRVLRRPRAATPGRRASGGCAGCRSGCAPTWLGTNTKTSAISDAPRATPAPVPRRRTAPTRADASRASTAASHPNADAAGDLDQRRAEHEVAVVAREPGLGEDRDQHPPRDARGRPAATVPARACSRGIVEPPAAPVASLAREGRGRAAPPAPRTAERGGDLDPQQHRRPGVLGRARSRTGSSRARRCWSGACARG